MQEAAVNFDPRAFAEGEIEETVRRQVERLEYLLAQYPEIHSRPIQEVREDRARGNGPLPVLPTSDRARARTIRGPAGEITLREFLPREVEGVYLHIHGEGWTLGSADSQDPRLERIADATNHAVVSVDYRLAPEHPYPAAPDDCEAAALWCAEHIGREFGTGRLIIGGESAGAHLALLTLLRLRDKHGFTGFAGANLLYGMYDLAGTPSARNWGDRNLVLNTPTLAWFVGNFIPADQLDVARLRHPDISPLYADLSDLPPALLSVGTLDPLLDDTLFLHARWLASGSASDLAVYPGGIHAFNVFPGELASAANTRTNAFIAGVGRD